MATRIRKVASRRSQRPLLLVLLVLTAVLLLVCLPLLRKQDLSSTSRNGSRSLLFANGAASSLVADISMPLNRPKVMAFVGINTGFGSKRRREALRMTWYPSSPEEHKRLEEETGIVFRFIIGQTSNKKQEEDIQEEIRQYGDFIRLKGEEKYLGLNKKTLEYFKTIFHMYDAAFYVKADDDIYLQTDRLAAVLRKPRKSPRTYLGCLKKGMVIGDPKYKWYEPKAYLLGKEYFLHAYGPIYALSADVVNIINSIPDGRLRMFINEDVTIGSWMLAFDVVHEQNLDLCSAKCTPRSIAVWDIPKCSGLCEPIIKMPQLHNDSACRERGQ